MGNYELFWGRFTRAVVFCFSLGLIAYEAIWDHSQNEIVYILAAGLGGGPLASLAEAIFTGRVQIQVTKKGQNGA